MKKTLLTLSLLIACTLMGMAQRPSVSILGDSYSTFEGYLTPDTMDIWYFAGSRHDARSTDVSKVSETWWMQLIK